MDKSNYTYIMYFLYFVMFFIYIASFFMDVKEFGYTKESAFYTRYMYMFTHQNILHLIANIYSFHLLYKMVMKLIPEEIFVPLMFISGVLMTYGTEMSKPTIGLSGIAFLLLGILFAASPKQMYIAVIVTTILNTVFYYFNTNVNVFIHLSGFIYGIIIYLIYKLWNKRKNKNKNLSAQ